MGLKVDYGHQELGSTPRAKEPVEQGTRSVGSCKVSFRAPLQGSIFELLVNAFIDDYMRKKYLGNDSGWRTLPSLAREVGISTRSMYSRYGGLSSDIGGLIRRGLLEDRI